MELRDLNSFIAVAEACGFRRAAEQLNIEQSALSRRVRNLENELGVSLFERHRGGVRLTRAGERFRAEIRTVLSGLDIAVGNATGAGVGQKGRIRLGVGATMFGGRLRHLMAIWRQQHPEVELSIVEAAPRDHLANLISRTLDLAIVAGTDWTGRCEAEVLWEEQVSVVVPTDIADEFKSPVSADQLRSRPFLVCRDGFGPQVRDWIIRRLSGLSTSPRVEFVDVSRGVLFSMVGLGLGLTFATSAEAEVEYPNLTFLPVADESMAYSALWLAENDNPALRRFLSLARMLARRLSAGTGQNPDPSP
jgi:DNA-binding transcriptional LysR family regulator